MGTRRLRSALALIAAGSFALACASGPAPRDHYYRLVPAAPSAPAAARLDGTIEVERLRVEAISQGRSMLYRQSPSAQEVLQHAYHHWTDPPSVMLQEQLVDHLRAAGVAQRVVTPAVNVDADFEVGGRLVRFERILVPGSARVVVEMELLLIRESDDELLLLETYREERAAAGTDVAASVAAWSAAVSTIFDRFVADLPAP